ncbi:hypothetical protein QNH46_02610 [Paenibacillus woosongensis]|uniref:Uncharacterized protein n=1 Tax=Paenibacillus woosongensis TaxID=307580 RepID=A0AA95I7X1_9BACL|nr:hypothetical protein [Paenibacillus woosongensis]WHX49597.1 hypothetical protein QNH46_02610 [Paenibacillus woosongensis]
MLFINFSSGLTILAIVAFVLILTFISKRDNKKSTVLKDMGSLIQSLSIAIAVGYGLVFLSEIGSVQDFSGKLHYSLVLIFYGVLVNLIANISARIVNKTV